MSIKTILFDLDGTLVDTIGDLLATTNYILAEGGRTPLTLNDIKPKVATGSLEMIRLGYPELSEQELLAKQQHFFQIYFDHIAQESRLFAGIDEILTRIKEQDYQWGIVTNKTSRLTDQLVSKLNLKPAVVVSGDTLKRKKPYPDPLLYACKQLGIKTDEAIFLGDDLKDIQAARAAKMKSVAVTYGYGNNADEWQADYVINHPAELWDCYGLA